MNERLETTGERRPHECPACGQPTRRRPLCHGCMSTLPEGEHRFGDLIVRISEGPGREGRAQPDEGQGEPDRSA